MSKDRILEVKDLRTSFFTDEGEVKAVDGVSFSIYRGETLGIVGESGSGKSVTSLSIMRLVPGPGGQVIGGQVLYYPESEEQGVDLLQVPRRQMQHYRGNEISMIFQEPMSSLNPVFRCGEQVAEAIRLHQKVDAGIAREKVMALFEKLQLPEPDRIY